MIERDIDHHEVGEPAQAVGHALLDGGHDPVAGQHRGIFWVELGVLITVCGVMLKIFYMFAGRGRES